MITKGKNSDQAPIVRSHILRNAQFDNWQSEIEGKWPYSKLYNDESWRIGWISFDAITWSEEESCLYSPFKVHVTLYPDTHLKTVTVYYHMVPFSSYKLI